MGNLHALPSKPRGNGITCGGGVIYMHRAAWDTGITLQHRVEEEQVLAILILDIHGGTSKMPGRMA
jgi:hypothetical protein